MRVLSVFNADGSTPNGSLIDEIVREGTRRMPAAALAMVFKLVESAQTRWRAVNAPHLLALVRACARFERGQLVECPEGLAA